MLEDMNQTIPTTYPFRIGGAVRVGRMFFVGGKGLRAWGFFAVR